MNKFDIKNETNEEINDIDTIKDLMNYALNYLKIENSVFDIIIVDLDTIHKINKEYRGKDMPTDVISFALEDDKTFNLDGIRVLGDIYICLDKIYEQSKEYGHSFLREFAFLSVHGLLHLLGYDHMTLKDEKVMFSLQDEILNSYGIKR